MTPAEFQLVFPHRGQPASEAIPAALGKATEDEYCYLLQTRHGISIIFSSATIRDGGEWVFLDGIDGIYPPLCPDGEFFFGRGIEVRLSDAFEEIERGRIKPEMQMELFAVGGTLLAIPAEGGGR